MNPKYARCAAETILARTFDHHFSQRYNARRSGSETPTYMGTAFAAVLQFDASAVYHGSDLLLETSMKRIYTTAITVSAALLLASAAHAQVPLNSVRIGAKDSVALAKFYQAAFGMQEVNRIDAQGGPEVFVNFGATIESAKANKS